MVLTSWRTVLSFHHQQFARKVVQVRVPSLYFLFMGGVIELERLTTTLFCLNLTVISEAVLRCSVIAIVTPLFMNS
jgi:hypothetical protein